MGHKIDRLWELPEPVVEHILSFIPLKKILQLSILSKRWQKVWPLFPLPEFDLLNRQGRNIEEFNYFVERTIVSRYRQKLSINKFSLKIVLFDSELNIALVNRFIRYAIGSNVKELNLNILPRLYYPVPESVLTANSITELKLSYCYFNSFYSDISLSSLKKLVLLQARVDDQIVKTLTAGCPVVEEIKFERCSGLKSTLHVSSPPKLMAIELIDNYHLESFEMAASNLKMLVLCSDNMTDKWLNDVLSKHPLIESLDLHDCKMLERIEISSDRMKSLTFSGCTRLVEVKIVTPNLHILEYYGHEAIGNYYLEGFEVVASNLKKLVLCSVNITDKWLNYVLSKHPLIESLELRKCKMLKKIEISSDRMKSLTFFRCIRLVEVDIVTPNLHILQYYGHKEIDNYSLKLFEMAASNLKKLVLCADSITDKWLNYVLSKHPLIESLELLKCEKLKRIEISSACMKSLTFFHCRRLVEVNIVTPNLHRLQYYGHAIPFSSNPSTLSEVSLDFKSDTSLDVEKIEFLARLNHPKLLTWRIDYAKSVIAPKELREILQSPLYNVKQLMLKVGDSHKRCDIIKLVDALLWISPLLEILFIEWGTNENISFKLNGVRFGVVVPLAVNDLLLKNFGVLIT